MQTRKQWTRKFEVLNEETVNLEFYIQWNYLSKMKHSLFQKYNSLLLDSMNNSYNFKKLTIFHKDNKYYTNNYGCAESKSSPV